MKAIDLPKKLLEEGCNPNNFAVLSGGDDAYCLNKRGQLWAVFYTERGLDSEPIFTSENEEEACEFYFNHILKQKHWHIVGFFADEQEAQSLESKLVAIGVKPIRNDIPVYNSLGDSRFRVFVVGKDIFKVREHFGEIEVTYS